MGNAQVKPPQSKASRHVTSRSGGANAALFGEAQAPCAGNPDGSAMHADRLPAKADSFDSELTGLRKPVTEPLQRLQGPSRPLTALPQTLTASLQTMTRQPKTRKAPRQALASLRQRLTGLRRMLKAHEETLTGSECPLTVAPVRLTAFRKIVTGLPQKLTALQPSLHLFPIHLPFPRSATITTRTKTNNNGQTVQIRYTRPPNGHTGRGL